MKYLNRINQLLHKTLVWIAGVFLLSMILLTCANIALRSTWKPIQGTFELMGFFGAIVTAFALADTQNKRGHIAVDVLVNTFPAGVRYLLRGINSLLCMGLFGIATWQISKKATILLKTGEVSETLRMIYYPFTYAVALGCAVLCLTFFIEFLNALFRTNINVSPRTPEDTK